MNINYLTLASAIENAAIEKITKKLTNLGYKLYKDYRIGDIFVDLLAVNNNSKIIYEFKTVNTKNVVNYDKLQMAAKQINAQLKIVFVNPPIKHTNFDIPNLKSLLETDLFNNFPTELDTLSTHTRLKYIDNIILDDVSFKEKFLLAKGSAVARLLLQYGSDSDEKKGDGIKIEIDVPFGFEAELLFNSKTEFKIKKCMYHFDTRALFD